MTVAEPLSGAPPGAWGCPAGAGSVASGSRAGDVVGRTQARGRSPQHRVHYGRRHAALGKNRDRGLADAELGEQVAEVVELGAGKVDTVALSAFASSGVNARTACWMRLPRRASTSPGTSFGVCVTKKTPTPLDRIRRTVCATESRSAFVAPSRSPPAVTSRTPGARFLNGGTWVSYGRSFGS